MTQLPDLRNESFQLNDTDRVRVTWDNASMARWETPPSGMIIRDLYRRGNRVRDAARRQIRFGHVGVGGRAAKGGRLNLRETIHSRLLRGSDAGSGAPILVVGSADPIALYHHEGTRPHVILPVRARRLVFWSEKAGRVIYAKKVNHPGTPPNRFLTDNLHLAAQ